MISKFLQKIFFLLVIMSFLNLSASARVLDLSSAPGEASYKLNAEVYVPSKLVIGTKTPFVIKAEPGTKVILTLAEDENANIPITRLNGQVGDKGVVEIEVEIPDEKDLVNRIVYFEVSTWKNEDMSDLKKAVIIAPDGRETTDRTLIIANKPSAKSLPGIGPSIPGVGDVSRVMESVQQNATYGEDFHYMNEPLILRNLRVPDSDTLSGEQNEQQH